MDTPLDSLFDSSFVINGGHLCMQYDAEFWMHFYSMLADVTQYVGIDASNSQLIYLNNSDDMDSDEFSLRMSLLSHHPVMNISRLLQDGHLYVFKRWVIDLIAE